MKIAGFWKSSPQLNKIQIYTLFSDLTDVDAIDQSEKTLLTNGISNYSNEVNGFVR